MLKNRTQRELLQISKNLIQPLLPTFHKGQAGKIAVIGGCEDYTGAPFFALHSAALVGADMVHVICEVAASPVIKLYSPDLMVHPYLFELHNPAIKLSDEETAKYDKTSLEDLINKDQPRLDAIIDTKILPKVQQVLNRADLVIVGPGFGRDSLMLKSLVRIIEEIKVMNKPVILDADALQLVTINPSIVKNYLKAILTPNVMEFSRLAKKFDIAVDLKETNLEKLIEETQRLSQALGGVTIVRKGKQELIVKSENYLINELKGSNKRVGGQGDTLTGAIATLYNWSNNYSLGLWDIPQNDKLERDDANLLSIFAACSLVRVASSMAFEKYGRSMQTSNIHEFIPKAYQEAFEGDLYLKL